MDPEYARKVAEEEHEKRRAAARAAGRLIYFQKFFKFTNFDNFDKNGFVCIRIGKLKSVQISMLLHYIHA